MTDLEWNETLIDIYQGKGWPLYKEFLLNRIEKLKEDLVTNASTESEDMLRGRIKQIREIINFPDLVEETIDILKSDEKDT